MAGLKLDRERAEGAIVEFLRALGLEGDDAKQTAARVTTAYSEELLNGYGVDVQALIAEGSEEVSAPADPVLVDGIYTATVCPHHLLVARGEALVAYEPGSRVLGLGTISKLVDACSRRLALQEEIAGNVVQALMDHAGAKGAFCRIVFDHACLQTRGAAQPTARAISFRGQGSLKDISTLEYLLGRKLSEV